MNDTTAEAPRNVITAAPRKAMSQLEQRFLRIAGEELAQVSIGGPMALAFLLDMVASWHGHPSESSFHNYGKRWLMEGGATNKPAERLLRDLFGLPDPKKAA